MAKNSKIKVEITSVDPYITTVKEMNECILCRNGLDELCNFCRVNGEQGKCCAVEGKCGHRFHKHCIDQWINNGHQECPYPGCNAKWEPI